jgi:mono/diheme cytochrome c family protein
LIASAVWLRRLRVLGPVLGIAVLALCLRTPVQLLSAEAFPTSFWQSPTGDTTRAVADGARAFAANCAACHGGGGAGNGPLAKGLRVPPADLTAEHVYDHSDGDLFWWISHGMANGAMPGFAPALDETTRWDLIDFVHANADGARLAGSVSGPARPMRAPNFAVACPGGAVADLNGLRGRVVHLVFADPAAPARLRQLQDQVNETAVTIVLDLPPSLDAAPLCRADEPSARAAYELFDGRGSMPIDGAEFLIDAAGWLRASWRPGQTPAWSDPAVLRAAVARTATTVVAAPAVQHMHHH